MNTLDHALSYAETGWRVFPCKPGEKVPLTTRGFHDATTSADQIIQWWRQWPSANLAVATGATSKIVALDIDAKNGKRGFDSLAELETEHGALPVTLTSRTPSGGEHLLFEHPGGEIPNRAGIRDGLDVRGDGGYIVAPPSTVNGKPYIWTREMDIAAPPAWFIKLLNTSKSGAGVDWDAVRDGVGQGKRNDTLFRFACSLRARGVLYEQARLQILEHAARCVPPLDPSEAEGIIRNVYKRYPEGGAFNLTDVGNAQRLTLQHGDDLRFCFRLRKWFIFNGTVWRPDEGEQIIQRAKDSVRTLDLEATEIADEKKRQNTRSWATASESEKRLKAAVELAKSEPGVPVTVEELDADPWLLGVRNGVVDLRAGELREARRGDLITKQATVDYDPAATCPTWRTFLEQIIPDGTTRGFVQRALGYSLTGDVREQCLFILYGTGANGKTTAISTVQTILGDYAKQTGAETWMAKDRGGASNDVARLRGARFVPTVEVEDGQRLAESLVKQITGQDTVAARFLYAEFFEFRPSFKIWLATNHKPIIRGDDAAIWRRIKLIPFTVTLAPEKQDKDLPAKLLAEAPGILNWMIAGCLEWQRVGLQEPEQVLAATADYRIEMDTVSQFISDECELGPTFSEAASELYRRYQTWCEASGVRYMSKNRFGRRLTERGIALQEARYSRRLGVQLKEAGE